MSSAQSRIPRELREDVGRVARNAEVTLEQIAADFGIHPVTLSKWMRQADVDEGTKPVSGGILRTDRGSQARPIPQPKVRTPRLFTA
ncbi:transposase [Nocardia sp. NPDC051900]|uniref:transposase n=1 Tax=Nocardia sp. NPDC051900 TaxID=3364326 RepID=UPI00378BD759